MSGFGVIVMMVSLQSSQLISTRDVSFQRIENGSKSGISISQIELEPLFGSSSMIN